MKINYKKRNSKLLKDFVKYCEKYPELRFWQALRSWANIPFILASDKSIIGDNIVGEELKDTFYWKGKNEHQNTEDYEVECPNCGGSGDINIGANICWKCNGKGKIKVSELRKYKNR